MILLLGGTSETYPVARELSDAGHDVLVSTATDLPLSLPDSDRISRRAGPLNAETMAELVRERDIRLIVDVTHPYAAEVSRNAVSAAHATNVPYLRLERAPVIEPAEDVFFADTHARAAALACRWSEPILTTIGTRNLAPYAGEARRHGIELFSRVLPAESAVRACRQAGVDPDHQIQARGPFSVKQNRRHLREHDIGVLVTKDSGRPGGTLHRIRYTGPEHGRRGSRIGV